jgi:hypothetical protein
MVTSQPAEQFVYAWASVPKRNGLAVDDDAEV